MFKLLYPGDEKGSSVSLIMTEKHIVVVDTSSSKVREILLRNLENAGIDTKDVDVVINTHLHPRHMGNNDLFPKAEIFASPHEFVRNIDNCLVYDEETIFRNVKELEDKELSIINTPGHTWGSISVIYDEYVVVGDAIPTRNLKVDNCVDDISARSSINRIIRLKKKIVTGHDGILLPEELNILF